MSDTLLVTDENHGQSRSDLLGFERGNLTAKIDINFLGDGAAINNVAHARKLQGAVALCQPTMRPHLNPLPEGEDDAKRR